MLTDVQHTLLARALIDANGGVDACCKPVTRVDRSALYAYRDFNSQTFMPADVIDQLESRIENPVYSSFLFASRQAPAGVACLEKAGCEIGEMGVGLQKLIRLAAEDGEISPNEQKEIQEALLALMRKGMRLGSALGADAGAAK